MESVCLWYRWDDDISRKDGCEVENPREKAIVVTLEPYGIHWSPWVMLLQMSCVI